MDEDITVRLRRVVAPQVYGDLSAVIIAEEAVKEIERLRELVVSLESERDMWESNAQRSS